MLDDLETRIKEKAVSSKKHVEPTFNQKQELLGFYGKQCVIHDIGPPCLNFHHINEIADKENTIFENLVPLCSNCNSAIELSKPEYKKTSINDDTRPENIMSRAKLCFSNGKYAASYGCYRIAAHLFKTRQCNHSRQLACLCFSIGSLRPVAELRLVRYTMLEVRKAFEEAGTLAPPRWRIDCMSQIGLLLFDFGIFRTSYECLMFAFNIAKKHHNKALVFSPYPEEEDQFIANLYRRLCFSMTAQVDVPQKFQEEVLDALHSGVNFFLSHGNYRGYATNLDVLAYRERELRGANSKLLFEAIEQALPYEEKFENDWVKASHYANLGFFYEAQYLKSKNKRNKDRAVKHLTTALKIYYEKEIRPEPSIAHNTRTLDEVLKSLGCTDVPLITQRGEFPLTHGELRDVLNSVSGHTA